jgi:hypothetical protein
MVRIQKIIVVFKSAGSFSFLCVLMMALFPLSDVQGQREHSSKEIVQNDLIETGISWPKGQALPHFAKPAERLDGLDMKKASLSSSEKAIFSALQGIVNKTKPRIILFDEVREGNYKWPNNLNLSVREWSDEWELLKKYQHEVAGIILYDREKSIHYLNLASTIGGLKNALPVTPDDLAIMNARGFNIPVLVDLTTMTITAPAEIYQYLYDNYWDECTNRLLVSLNPRFSGYIRDIGMASQSAIVWLDPRKEEESDVLSKFLGDMKAGESIIIGWWAEERSGIGIGTSFGISTIPADFYENTTVYAGGDRIIQLPVVPKKPALENKIYLAIFLSDGDNVQYCQHAMSELWDNENRGIVPINWTVSPGLVDMGPGLLNYYYSTATPNDFFASGPSGLGYALIYDAHNEVWNMTSDKHMDAYTKFTQRYLEKSGLRIITIWDEINEQQMEIYSENCRYLYGVTLEDWERSEPLKTFVKKDRLAFIPNHPCYASNIEDIYVRWQKKIQNFDGSNPLFLAAQGESWRMGPDNIVLLKEKLEKLSPGNIVICRGDHFFTLFNEANHHYFNLTLMEEMVVTSSIAETPAAFAADGTPSGDRMWISSGSKDQWIQFDFNKPYLINRYVIRHAGVDGLDSLFNTRSFQIETSIDGMTWRKVSDQSDNINDVTDSDIAPVQARYVRLNILNAGADGIARIGDIEIYGKRIP